MASSQLDCRYRTIVADPPWEIGAFPEWGEGRGTIPTPYSTMSLQAIKDLPVGTLAAPEAHLYLWTTVQFLVDSYDVAKAWGFEPMYPLVWCKPPRGQGLGGKFSSNVEFVLFCRERHGAVTITSFLADAAQSAGLKALIGFDDRWDSVVQMVNDHRHEAKRCDTRWFEWPRGRHSEKPEAFLDLVESVSPGPYVELFARRDRLGWDTWGNESLGTAEMAA